MSGNEGADNGDDKDGDDYGVAKDDGVGEEDG